MATSGSFICVIWYDRLYVLVHVNATATVWQDTHRFDSSLSLAFSQMSSGSFRFSSDGSPLICKTAPYNICYKLGKDGQLMPLVST